MSHSISAEDGFELSKIVHECFNGWAALKNVACLSFGLFFRSEKTRKAAS